MEIQLHEIDAKKQKLTRQVSPRLAQDAPRTGIPEGFSRDSREILERFLSDS